MTHPLLTLILTSLTALPPEATRHSEQAAAHHDAGRLDAAIHEFAAAYASLPDPRRYRADREQMLGSPPVLDFVRFHEHSLLLSRNSQDHSPSGRPVSQDHSPLAGSSF